MRHYYKVVAATILLVFIFILPLDVISSLIKKEKLVEVRRVLIVPGHEPKDGGAIYQSLKERDVVVDLANKIEKKLLQYGNIEVVMARNKSSWSMLFEEYFETNKKEIEKWIEENKQRTNESISSGTLEEVTTVEHNSAPTETAFRLFAINKWAQNNNIDLVIHLHINDDTRRNRKVPGKHSGFSIYIPERQYVNSAGSRKFAEILKKNLSEVYDPSTLAVEKDTIIESQKLIAIGRYQTLDQTPVALIEYGYIYEAIFSDSKKEESLDVMSSKTVKTIATFLSL